MPRTLLVLAAAMAACGDPEPTMVDAGTRDAGPAERDAGTVTLTDIEVAITSPVASFEGRVLVGAFRMSPPTMPPVAVQRLTSPAFPTTATLRDLEPGTYYAIAVLDFDPPSPTIPGVEDTTATSAPITITGEETMPVEVALELPDPAAAR